MSTSHYIRTDPEGLSDQDLMSVTLRVDDWKYIAECLTADADASSMGPAEVAFIASCPDEDSDEYDEDREDAQKEDAEAPCGANTWSTMRCSDAIFEALREHGWPG
jgi:hypothetical protein